VMSLSSDVALLFSPWEVIGSVPDELSSVFPF
jgi:hypothetical protein